MNFYAERFREIFRETGDNLAKAGSQIGGVADQLADWIRARGGPGGGGGGSGSGGRAPAPARGSGESGRPGSDSPGGDVFGDELDDEA